MICKNYIALPIDEAEQIYALHRKGLFINKVIMACVLLEAGGYYLGNSVLHWKGDVRDYFAAIWITIELPHLVFSKLAVFLVEFSSNWLHQL